MYCQLKLYLNFSNYQGRRVGWYAEVVAPPRKKEQEK